MRIAVIGTVFFVLLGSSPTVAESPRKAPLQETEISGGFAVQVGCDQGELAAALQANDSLVVQALDTNATNIERIRARIASLGRDGQVSARLFDGQRLPYADNLVNVIITENLGEVAMAEVMRVLCPGGRAYIKRQGGWTKKVKPWPAEIDEWPQCMHGPGNNAVADDLVVGPPRHFQWINEPRFARSHDHLASVSAVVSSGGRLFYIVDTGSIAFVAAKPKWRLVCRDAFNGVKLWERGLSSWEYHLRDFRSGPADLARRLVAIEDRVYVTLGYGEPVTALDAATGETVRTYADTEETQEIVYDDGTLLLVLGRRDRSWRAQKAKRIVSQQDYHPPFERYTPPTHQKRIMAITAESGETQWKNAQPHTQGIMPSTLASSGERVFFQNADAVICLDGRSGELDWRAPRSIHRRRLAWSTPTLVAHDGVVFSADRRAVDTEGEILWMPSGGYHEYLRGEEAEGELIAFDAETGDRLWSCPAYEGFNAPVDVMIADGLLWTGRFAWGNDPGITEGRDPRTGEVVRERPADQEFLPRIGHARCHRAKATSKYLVLGRRGVEFVNLETGDMVANFWVRGGCQYGFTPANGLLYVPPHACACNVKDMLKSGFMALAPGAGKESSTQSEPSPALTRGPAYGMVATDGGSDQSDAWPTYRHDPERSGATASPVSPNLTTDWETKLDGQLTSPVIAKGVLLVAATDKHQVHALDADTGQKLWSYQAAARIDSPPTIDQGGVLFGSADGRVYCLRLEDGALVWTFHAAPKDRQIMVDGQLESAWPVSGSLLVVDGTAYFAVGRNSYLDGGMFLCKLDAKTGKKLDQQLLAVDQEKRDGGITSGGYLPDVLAAKGDSIFMRGSRFDRELVKQKDNVPHLWSSVGFLDHNWWHRTYWQIGTSMGSGWGGWPKAGRKVPAGRLLVTDGSRVFGFGRNQYDIPGAHVGIDAATVWGPIGKQQGRWTSYRLFGEALDGVEEKSSSADAKTEKESSWAHRVPVLARAMVLAGETLLVAGPPDPVREVPHEPARVDPLADALDTDRAGRLLAVSATNGETLADYELNSPPVFDGVAVANQRVYLATKMGEVICMEAAQ
ncbi:MAG: PQQ-binding-like beta-propeller repeat protein [Pirellulaceae bacterium]